MTNEAKFCAQILCAPHDSFLSQSPRVRRSNYPFSVLASQALCSAIKRKLKQQKQPSVVFGQLQAAVSGAQWPPFPRECFRRKGASSAMRLVEPYAVDLVGTSYCLPISNRVLPPNRFHRPGRLLQADRTSVAVRMNRCGCAWRNARMDRAASDELAHLGLIHRIIGAVVDATSQHHSGCGRVNKKTLRLSVKGRDATGSNALASWNALFCCGASLHGQVRLSHTFAAKSIGYDHIQTNFAEAA